ncbi:CBS domain-containing protein [Caulobacter sp. 17J80-11]|uniref:CBS domain-containing protein n=1 Tax=Caulobacter sp. 17J80-11 TaxID=2763502 RepID=UPI001653D7DA|nr:CBS domain-containing protein [Caulobacter sp. 17J80-11]MBC6981420.1 CBS domain-containing protein [Caulobacter sp. 17J80-11]
MMVREVMTKGAEVIGPEASALEAARRMRDYDLGSLPVGEGDRLIGMITDRDIAVRVAAADKRPGECSVREAMSEHVYYVFDDADCEDAAEEMARHQVRRLAVLNRDKRLVGVLSIGDLGLQAAAAAGRALKGVARHTDQARQ